MDAAWHPDPGGRHELRYWDGSSWTDHVSDNGVTSLDPLPPYPGALPESQEPQDYYGAHAAGSETGQGGQGGGYESQDGPAVDLSTEPTRFAPGAALPSYDQHEQAPAQDEPPAYEAWSPRAAEQHEAETMQPSSEPIFASLGEGKPDLASESSGASGASGASEVPGLGEAEAEVPAADHVPADEPAADPDAWVRGLLADGERLVDTVRGDEREVTVTSHRVIVREHAGGWSALRLDRVSHVDVIGDGTGREAVQVHVAGGPSYRVTGDTEQAAALVRALTT